MQARSIHDIELPLLNGEPASLSAYAGLSDFPDDAGKAGNVTRNFEKFLVDEDGRAARRFRPKVVPEDATVVEAIESLL